MLIYYIDSSEISLSYKLALIIHGPDRSYIKRNFFPLRCNSLAQHFQNTVVHGLSEGETCPNCRRIGGSVERLPRAGEAECNWLGGKKQINKKISLNHYHQHHSDKKDSGRIPRSSSSIIKDFAPFLDIFCAHSSCLCQFPTETNRLTKMSLNLAPPQGIDHRSRTGRGVMTDQIIIQLNKNK